MMVESEEVDRLATDDRHRCDRCPTIFHKRKQLFEELRTIRFRSQRSDLAKYVHTRFLQEEKTYFIIENVQKFFRTIDNKLELKVLMNVQHIHVQFPCNVIFYRQYS